MTLENTVKNLIEKPIKALGYSEIDVKFVNLNELEFSESNWNMMSSYNYAIKNEISAAVNGSEETALRMMEKHSNISIHYCSSCFK